MVPIILLILVYVLVNLYFASLMTIVAKEKGYENSNVFVLVLFFGIIGILYAIALPDLQARQQREDILNVLLEMKEREE